MSLSKQIKPISYLKASTAEAVREVMDTGERIQAVGYRWRSYAENIAAGHKTVAGVTESWLNSPDHCRNLMSASIAELGAAIAEGIGVPYFNYWTLVFAHPSQRNN